MQTSPAYYAPVAGFGAPPQQEGTSFLFSKHLHLKRNACACGGPDFEITAADGVAVMLAKWEGCWTRELVVRDGMGKHIARIKPDFCFRVRGLEHAVIVNGQTYARIRRDPRSLCGSSLVAISGYTGQITHEVSRVPCSSDLVVLRQEPGARPGSGHSIARAYPDCGGTTFAVNDDVGAQEVDLVLMAFLVRAMMTTETRRSSGARQA